MSSRSPIKLTRQKAEKLAIRLILEKYEKSIRSMTNRELEEILEGDAPRPYIICRREENKKDYFTKDTRLRSKKDI